MIYRRWVYSFVRLASFVSSLPLSVTAAYRRMLQGGASEVCYTNSNTGDHHGRRLIPWLCCIGPVPSQSASQFCFEAATAYQPFEETPIPSYRRQCSQRSRHDTIKSY